MTDTLNLDASLVALLGGAVACAVLIKAYFHRLGIPALVGYLLLGFLLRLADVQWNFMTEIVWQAFRLMADLGIVALLFKVGLNSHPNALAAKLPQALPVWTGDVLVSGAVGFVTTYFLLDVALIPSLFVATALTATSVGVSLATWEEARALDSPNGQLLLDVAELDDISAVALMALLFAITPVLLTGNGHVWNAVGNAAGLFLLKFSLFIVFCVVFSRYAEPQLSRWAAGIRQPPQRMLIVAAIGFLIAAFAEWLGLSLAIGALFAGLVFSRDPEAVKTEKSFEDMYAFFTPFFFISIGLHVAPGSLTQAVWVGSALVAAGVLGKFVGAGLTSWFTLGSSGALLIGASMIPRAEIAMVIMHQGQQFGQAVVPDSIYAGMVLVTAVTCLASPLALHPLLKRWPQKKGAKHA